MELKVMNVTKKFKDKVAVDHMNMEMGVGVYGLLGANGAGKTTLMRLLCSVANPSSGKILYNGKDIQELKEEYRDILGYLPQKFGYYPDFTAKDFMYYISALKGLSIPQAKKKTEELLEMVGLADVQKKKIKTFSGGMIQRLGIAQAMLNNPKILVLDEPTAGLDPKERVRFRNILAKLAGDRLVILSTHIVSDVEYIANHIMMMKDGNIVLQGSVQEICASIDQCVWECVVQSSEVDAYNQKYCISNLHNEGNKTLLRIVSDHQPHPQAHIVTPTLEDVYLYEFQEVNECIR